MVTKSSTSRWGNLWSFFETCYSEPVCQLQMITNPCWAYQNEPIESIKPIQLNHLSRNLTAWKMVNCWNYQLSICCMWLRGGGFLLASLTLKYLITRMIGRLVNWWRLADWQIRRLADAIPKLPCCRKGSCGLRFPVWQLEDDCCLLNFYCIVIFT